MEISTALKVKLIESALAMKDWSSVEEVEQDLDRSELIDVEWREDRMFYFFDHDTEVTWNIQVK